MRGSVWARRRAHARRCSTGKPKGMLHTTGGYLLGAAMTVKYVFDTHEGDIFGCVADVG